MRIARFGREEFLKDRWDYRRGQHVSVIAPTQNGKTTWVFELLANTNLGFCEIPPTMLVAKPKDAVVSYGLEDLGYAEIDRWPPPKKWFSNEKPLGYGLWPKHLKDVEADVDNAHIGRIMRKSLRELFWRGNTVCVADEVYELSVPLALSQELTRHWTQGAGMGSALWSATQKPSGTQAGSIPTFMYNSPTHTFLGRDSDERNRKRFGEIGGVSPRLVEDTVMGLGKYEWLYIHRDGPTMGIVEAN